MLSNSDLQLWQAAVQGINASDKNDLKQEEWQALSTLNNSLNNGDFVSDESRNAYTLLSNNLANHSNNQELQKHLYDFLMLCYNQSCTASVSENSTKQDGQVIVEKNEKQYSLVKTVLFGVQGLKQSLSKNLKLAAIYLLVAAALAGAIYALSTSSQINMPGYVTAVIAGVLASVAFLRKNQNGEIREKFAFLCAVVIGIYMYSTRGGQISGGYTFAWTFVCVGAVVAFLDKNKPNLFLWLAEVVPAVLLFLAFERLGGAISGFGAKDIVWGNIASARYVEAFKIFLLFCLFQSFANNAVVAQYRELVRSKLAVLFYGALAVVFALLLCVFLNPFKLSVFDTVANRITAFSQPVRAAADVFDKDGRKIGSATKTPRTSPLLSKHIPGYLATAYDFSYDGDFDKANITFEFDAGLGTISDYFQPRIYYFNESDGTLEELPNQEVKRNFAGNGWASVTAMTEHFSTYILLNSVEYNKVWNTIEIRKPKTDECSCGNTAATATNNFNNFDVVFVIDESGSMQQNDPANLRVDAAKKFVDLLADDSKNNRISIYGFENYSRKISGLTALNNKETVKTLLNSIHAGGGTNIHSGLQAAVQEIQANNAANFSPVIILMTDGQDNSNIKNYADLIATANAKGITVFAIGLGQVDDNLLRQICDNTGGGVYYYAGKADELPFIFKSANAAIVDYVKDSNGDGISDYYAELLRNGTLRLSNGSKQFAGIDWVNCPADLDGDGLKNGEELIIKEQIINGTTQVYAYMSSDPTKKENYTEETISPTEEFKLNPYVYNIELADTLALYAALAYDETRIVPKPDVDYLLKTKPFPFPPPPNTITIYSPQNEYFSHYLSKYTELKEKDDIVYFSGKRDDAYVGKGNNKPFVLMKQLKYDGFIGVTSCNYNNDNEHDISHTLAYKKVNNNEIVLAVILRGTDFVEWRGNMDIWLRKDKPSDRHYSFQKANESLQERIICYINRYNLKNVNFLITGHSRGAAVANLLAVDLNEKEYINKNSVMYGLNERGVKNIYAYTFATPNNMKSNYVKPYKNIFNFCFEDDFVPQVPLTNSGWDYGKSGIIYSKVAEYEYAYTPNFKEMEDRYIYLSRGGKPDFSYQATKDVLDAFHETARTVDKYYDVKLKMEPLHGWTGKLLSLFQYSQNPYLSIAASMIDPEEDKTLHEFMRDYIANATIYMFEKPSASVGTVSKILLGNDVQRIGNFFFYEGVINHSINDTHQALTYYNAQKAGVFRKRGILKH